MVVLNGGVATNFQNGRLDSKCRCKRCETSEWHTGEGRRVKVQMRERTLMCEK